MAFTRPAVVGGWPGVVLIATKILHFPYQRELVVKFSSIALRGARLTKLPAHWALIWQTCSLKG